MKPLTITSRLEVYDSLDELPEHIQSLMKQAIETRNTAYAPYSSFQVGAAMKLDNGQVVVGSNQENASYPSGLCAERTAVYAAGAQFPGAQIEHLAISAKSLKHQVVSPVPPCGACRQALVEYEVKQEKPIEIYFMGETGKVVKAESVKDLLPLVFDNSCL
ncbi:MAG: cytidine deaminase [Bacteroidota bacterium]|uniref:Cytidine deaminase n=1 Tax=Christiangramia flava JLT2011 TaxID=1229726 RepID=A0A1L7I346_9FLAO|nr:cytidine deaminase [Christiangramia flava]APU67565.1 Cytidine deaminase [Christiangramia flava JLT2011]MAM19062.1 cytidine deaminase [Christiangramia sp.]MEE2773032.1 cytidine deaminase [Bacteroidota bacterium]OSS40151.1 Cytidine deaminase [Christiangramia flava JLT2011]